MFFQSGYVKHTRGFGKKPSPSLPRNGSNIWLIENKEIKMRNAKTSAAIFTGFSVLVLAGGIITAITLGASPEFKYLPQEFQSIPLYAVLSGAVLSLLFFGFAGLSATVNKTEVLLLDIQQKFSTQEQSSVKNVQSSVNLSKSISTPSEPIEANEWYCCGVKVKYSDYCPVCNRKKQ
jgi:hypothetical protein